MPLSIGILAGRASGRQSFSGHAFCLHFFVAPLAQKLKVAAQID
jgi:hypothetical protein